MLRYPQPKLQPGTFIYNKSSDLRWSSLVMWPGTTPWLFKPKIDGPADHRPQETRVASPQRQVLLRWRLNATKYNIAFTWSHLDTKQTTLWVTITETQDGQSSQSSSGIR